MGKLEQDIQDLTQNIDDLNDAFTALNSTMVKNLGQMGASVVKQSAAINTNTTAINKNTQANNQATYDEVQRAKRRAQTSLETEKYMKSFMGRLEMAAGSSEEAQKSLIRLTNFVNGTSQVLGTLGKTAFALGKSLFEGKEGASANNDAIDAFTKGIEGILGKFGPFGFFLGKIVGLLGGFAKEANLMSDRMYKSYQELSKIGVTTADGMLGVADAAQRLGFSLDDAGMAEFARVMKSASQGLALMSGSAVKGGQDFVNFASTVVRGQVGRELMNLGFSAAELNQGLADYVNLQSRVGMTQNRSVNDLAKGAAAYLKEMDILTKLTGKQRQEMEEAINRSRAIEQFRAKTEMMRRSGDKEQQKAAMEAEKLFSLLPPQLAQGFAESFGGYIVTEQGAKFQQMMGFQMDMADQFVSGQSDAVRMFGRIANSANETINSMGPLGLAGAFNNLYAPINELADISGFAGRNFENAAELQAELQKRQADGPGGVAAQTDMRRAQMDSRAALQQLAVTASQATTPAMAGLASVTRTVVQGLGGKVPEPGAMATGAAPAAAGRYNPRRQGAAAGAAGVATSAQDLASAGLVIKQGDVQATGSAVSPRLIALAKQIQSEVPGFSYFSGFNDRFHQENAPASAHTRGLAADFAVNPPPTREQGQAIVNQLKAMGFATVLDEYNNPSSRSTGGHFHAAIQAATGGVFAGPRSGYNAVLHGSEAVVPLPDGKTIPVEMPNLDRSMEQQVSMLGAQLVALEELVRYMRDNNAISTRILQAANN